MWSTNATNRQNRQALYFDAANAAHYGKYLNDMWSAHGNNCELKWNPATGRVEVYALRDILLNEELGTDYGAPFWYQAHNGLTNREQAHQIQTYYRRSTLPWYAKHRSNPPPRRLHQKPTAYRAHSQLSTYARPPRRLRRPHVR